MQETRGTSQETRRVQAPRDDCLPDSRSLPKVEDGVTIGVLVEPIRQHGMQQALELPPHPRISLHNPSEIDTAGLLETQDPALLSALPNEFRPVSETRVDDAGASDTDLKTILQMNTGRTESGWLHDAPQGFALVASDPMVRLATGHLRGGTRGTGIYASQRLMSHLCTGGHVREDNRVCEAFWNFLPRFDWKITSASNKANAPNYCGRSHDLIHAQMCSCFRLRLLVTLPEVMDAAWPTGKLSHHVLKAEHFEFLYHPVIQALSLHNGQCTGVHS